MEQSDIDQDIYQRRLEASEARESRIRIDTLHAIEDNYLGVEILTESELTDDVNWRKFLDVIVRHAEGKLTIPDKVLAMDMILNAAVKYAGEVIRHEAE